MKRFKSFAVIGALLFALPASPTLATHHSRAHSDWGRCIAYLPQITTEGRLQGGETKEVFTWNTTCHSSFTASATGASIRVQRLVGGTWQNLTSGISSYIADLGPGTYRILAVNIYQTTSTYSVRHRRGLG